MTECKVKGATLDFSSFKSQDWMVCIWHYFSEVLMHPSFTLWVYSELLKPEGMERGQRFLLTKTRKDELLHSKSLPANQPHIVSHKNSGEAGRKVHKRCSTKKSTSSSQLTCLYYREIHWLGKPFGSWSDLKIARQKAVHPGHFHKHRREIRLNHIPQK